MRGLLDSRFRGNDDSECKDAHGDFGKALARTASPWTRDEFDDLDEWLAVMCLLYE